MYCTEVNWELMHVLLGLLSKWRCLWV